MPGRHHLPFAVLLAAFSAVLVSTATAASAVRPAVPEQDRQRLTKIAEDFLLEQAAALPGQAVVSVQAPTRAAPLPACDRLTPFLTGGARLRPRLSVGLRCTAPAAWTVYLQASMRVAGQYYVAARTLHPGDPLPADALSPRRGDLLGLPADAVMDPATVAGHVAQQRIAVGQIVRLRALRAAQSVQRGQTVRIVARGPGFQVSSEGQALESAPPGKPVQVRTPSGQTVTAIVQNAQTVEISL